MKIKIKMLTCFVFYVSGNFTLPPKDAPSEVTRFRLAVRADELVFGLESTHQIPRVPRNLVLGQLQKRTLVDAATRRDVQLLEYRFGIFSSGFGGDFFVGGVDVLEGLDLIHELFLVIHCCCDRPHHPRCHRRIALPAAGFQVGFGFSSQQPQHGKSAVARHAGCVFRNVMEKGLRVHRAPRGRVFLIPGNENEK